MPFIPSPEGEGSSRRNYNVNYHIVWCPKYRKAVHKVARSLVERYDGFAVESLNIKNMVKNRHLARSISDAGWGMFLNVLGTKVESAGRWHEKVSPNGTSQACSRCGVAVRKFLAVRLHDCPQCGLSLDRDVNAGINILARTGPSWRDGVSMPLVEARS